MSLFDASPYGPERTLRKKPKPLPMLKLEWPWLLARTVKKEPKAHYPFRTYNNRDETPVFTPECNHKIELTVLNVDGQPVVDICRQCLEWARKNRKPMELRERPE